MHPSQVRTAMCGISSGNASTMILSVLLHACASQSLRVRNTVIDVLCVLTSISHTRSNISRGHAAYHGCRAYLNCGWAAFGVVSRRPGRWPHPTPWGSGALRMLTCLGGSSTTSTAAARRAAHLMEELCQRSWCSSNCHPWFWLLATSTIGRCGPRHIPSRYQHYPHLSSSS